MGNKTKPINFALKGSIANDYFMGNYPNVWEFIKIIRFNKELSGEYLNKQLCISYSDELEHLKNPIPLSAAFEQAYNKGGL